MIMNCMTIAMQIIIYYYMNIIILLSVNYVTFDLMIFNPSDKITVDRAASHFRCSKHPVNRSTFKIVLNSVKAAHFSFWVVIIKHRATQINTEPINRENEGRISACK